LENSNKIYYSLRETEQLTELPAATLRYWESQFEDLRPRKDGHGNRYYTQEDINLIKRIRFIRDEMHITRIVAIKHELQNDTRHTDQRQRATELLLKIRQELVAIRKYLYQNPPQDSETPLSEE